ncbi:armadillo repeat-containing protein 2-like isoform X3 [Amphibalanus amphitrite]|uniref:armadillo repeat-containing protein 2-like isoform X3 n=1 Tax=Amphibalanus amphitrite TaxID=1232801 RepID=UPI001C928286|nr:armadillo repeat-containing protein 2-like isoform X3 [Amphibalanus amphitrite]
MDYSDYCRLSSSDEEDQQQQQQQRRRRGQQPADMTELMSGQASAGRHGGLPANGDLPFYALPRAKKTSAEIIHEAQARAALGDGRAVVRTVDTSRPFTPRDRQRTLFGTAQTSPTSGRPTSAFSMNSLSLSFDTNDSRPVSGVRLLPLTTGRCSFGKNGNSPRQESIENVTFPALSDAGSKGNYHLPALTAHDRVSRRQFRAASLDKLPEEGEEMLAAALSSRNAHSGPRERTRHPVECVPRPGVGHPLPELGSAPRPADVQPLSVQRQIVEALRPTGERAARPPPPPSAGHLLQLVLSQPEDAGDLHLSDLESSQRMTSGPSTAAPSSAASATVTPADSEPEAESADDFGWSLFRKKRGIPATTRPAAGRAADRKPDRPRLGVADDAFTSDPTAVSAASGPSGGGDAMARLHPDAAPLRRPVVARRGRSSSPRAPAEPPEVAEYAESRPGSAVSGTGPEEEERPRSQEQQILALLARLTEMADNGADNAEVLTSVVDLYQLLADTNHLGRGSQHRIATLKTIFRFVDRQHPRLLMQISRTILALQVSGKNLTSVCKLVFKVAQDDENDALFLEGNFLELLLEIIGRSSPLDDGEACVYSYGALKFLTMNPALVTRLMSLGILDLVVLHLKLITTKKLESKRVSEQTGHALYQLTGVLRNLANVDSTLPRLVSSGATAQISGVLALFSADMDVISNVARILSIISTHDECCEQLVESDLSFRACIKVLKKYPGANNIVVRMGYALGNLMARSESARVKFFREPEALETLLNLLDMYSRRTASSSNNNGTASSEAGEAGDSAANDPGALSGTPEDVIVKLIRVVANMVINQEVGSEVSSSPACLKVLLGVLRTHSVEEHEELVLSSLSMLNNLTFYASEESVVFERQAEVTHCLCSMLRKEHTECQIEVLRVFGNLTRWPAVREALADREVVSRLVTLLDSDNRELVYTTVGVLINLMTDPGKRSDFNSFGGIDKLILVLEDFGYSDWQLAALVCKVLWNLAADTDDAGQVFSDQQADQLAVVLDEYLDDEVLFPESGLTAEEQQIAAMLRPLWEEFADVAASLLEKLDDSLESVASAAAATVPSESSKTA